jgi:hypothetical protein
LISTGVPMRIFNYSINHSKLYFYLLTLTAVCLPISKFALSVSMVSLLVNYIIELDFKRKFDALKRDKSILIFTLIFFIHILWLINTHNFKYAFHDIGNKAILLLYPIIIGTSEKISKHWIKIILMWFAAALLVSSLISTSILVGIIGNGVADVRDISPFMSHIRLSLLVNMGVFSLSYLLFSGRFELLKWESFLYILIIFWFIVFLFLLKSLTGLIIFSLVLFVSLLYISNHFKKSFHKAALRIVLICVVLIIGIFITRSINRFYLVKNIDIENLESTTLSGNQYKHYKTRKEIENGNYVWLNLSFKELKQEWEKRSDVSFEGVDFKNQKLRVTLIRYLTSKGFKKDSVGISKLFDRDIQNIEKGMANYIYQNKYALYPLLYKVIWEIDVYKKGNNPAGNSITQRIEFLKAAKGIIADNFYFGVGTGDVNDCFNKQYKLIKSKLPKKKRLRAHNQYVTFLLTFGIFGFLFLFSAMFYPVYKKKGLSNYLFLVFFIIVLLSFINEDTLETQIGVTFFSYFYSLFLFGSNLFLKEGKGYV